VNLLRLTIAAAPALAAAGCLGQGQAQKGDDPVPGTGTGPKETRAAVAPRPDPLPRAFLSVVDGDTGERVDGATIELAGMILRTNPAGLAVTRRIDLAKPRVRVSAPGYIPRLTRIRLPGRIAVYRRDLQWPVYGANPARTQVHPAIDLKPPFRTVWQRGTRGMIEFPAVVWEGVAYVNNIRGYTTALSMRNGRVLWRRRVGTRMAASPGIDTERRLLVVPTMNPGYVSVLTMDRGKSVWRHYTGRTEASPVVRDGIAYLAAENGNVYALDLERRKPLWVRGGAAKITSSPALVGNRLYVGDYGGRVFALDSRTGRRIWTGSAGSRVYGTVAVVDGRVFAPSVFSGMSALSARSGRLLWRVPVGSYVYSSPAAYRGRVYFGSYSGLVYCVSARSGRILWTGSAGGSVSGAVQVVAGTVYAGSFGHRITAWHWRTGKRVWTFPHGEYVAVSGNGRRLLMHGFSRIWAVEPKSRR
jgi:outer membrane protein assembly factor BamB